MTVAELIKLLETFDQSLQVWISMNDEYANKVNASAVWVGDPTPNWKKRNSTRSNVSPDRLVISDYP